MSAALQAPSRESVHAAVVAQGFSVLDLFDAHPWLARGADWTAWRAFLAATHGLPMSQQEYDIFKACTGRKNLPGRQVDEAWMVVGRRGRKSAIGALIGSYHAAYRDVTAHLAPGESARVLVMAKDLDEAKAIHAYALAILTDPALAFLLDGDPKGDEIKLTTRIDLKIKANSLVGGRSRAIVCALLDEVAFWAQKGSVAPDEEIVRGIRPAMANIPGSILIGMSSPYAQRGLLYEAYVQHYGVEADDVLVWKAPTLTMHDTVPIRVWAKKEYAKDPVAAAAEVGGNFRKDVKAFISRDVVMALVAKGRRELTPCSWEPNEEAGLQGPNASQPRRFSYWGFVDTSGGSQDAFTLAVAHWDWDRGAAVLDLVRSWSPGEEGKLSIEDTVDECAGILKLYRCPGVMGDRYAGRWPQERFAKAKDPDDKARDIKVGYEVCPRSKHQLYRDLLPTLNSSQVELLDVPALIDELCNLDRRMTPTGQERIDHPPGGHDDLINAAAGALLQAYDHGQYLKEQEPDQPPAKTTQDILDREIREWIEEAEERHQTVRLDAKGQAEYDRWQD